MANNREIWFAGMAFGLSARRLMLANSGNQPEPGGGAVAFNIAYGDTAPADTSKLWVKAPQATKVDVKSSFVQMPGEVEEAIQVLSTPLHSMASAVIGTKVYLIGGSTITNGRDAQVDTVVMFDVETKTISTLGSKLLHKAQGIAAAVVGTKIYLFGGSYVDSNNQTQYSNYISVFDPEDNSVSKIIGTTLPVACCNMCAAAIGTKVYLFGGYKGNSAHCNSIYMFDTENNTIATLAATLPKKSSSIAAAVIGTKVYLFGGIYAGASNSNAYLDTINVFDAEKKTISTLWSTLAMPVGYMSAVVLGTKVYLFGGLTDTERGVYAPNRYSTIIDEFDSEAGTRTMLDTMLPAGAYSMGTAAIGTKIYLFGGCINSDSSGNRLNINEFTVSTPLPENNLIIETDIAKNLVNLVSTDIADVEIGIKNVYIGNSEGYAEKVPAYLYRDGAWVEV